VWAQRFLESFMAHELAFVGRDAVKWSVDNRWRAFNSFHEQLETYALMNERRLDEFASGALHKYAGEILAMTVEHNQPQDGDDDCR
jgi:hypothetical protein